MNRTKNRRRRPEGETMVAPNKDKIGTFLITRNDSPVTILLIDDDPDCRMLIRDAIAECKVSNDVHEVANGLEAIEFLERKGRYAKMPRPGLIFMDIEMPGMNGLTALERIKGDPRFRDVPVVM